MGKKKNKTKSKSVTTETKRIGYGVEIEGILYYFDEYDYDAIHGLLLMKEVMESNK